MMVKVLRTLTILVAWFALAAQGWGAFALAWTCEGRPCGTDASCCCTQAEEVWHDGCDSPKPSVKGCGGQCGCELSVIVARPSSEVARAEAPSVPQTDLPALLPHAPALPTPICLTHAPVLANPPPPEPRSPLPRGTSLRGPPAPFV